VTPADASAVLVLAARERTGRCWVRVRLPSRPNSESGWVNGERLELSSTTWRLVVHVGSRRLDMLRRGRLVRRVAVVVGAPLTPTPRGLFAIAGAWKWRPRDFYGAWVLTLTDVPDGTHTYSVTATDAAGNTSPATSVTVTVDTVPPVAQIDSAPASVSATVERE